jgi:hypothetical protein
VADHAFKFTILIPFLRNQDFVMKNLSGSLILIFTLITALSTSLMAQQAPAGPDPALA